MVRSVLSNAVQVENVYNIIKPPSPVEIKPPMYVSQSSKAVRAEYQAGKSAHLTMGEAETALAAPEEFLRKNTRQATFHKRAKSARAHREVPRCETHHPPVPKLTDHVATPMRHRRNFVAKNSVDAMISAAVETAAEEEKFVDGPSGSTQNKMRSGMVEVYTQQKKFARIPPYLERFRRLKEDEQRRWEEEKREEARRLENMKLSDGEREKILQGLRTNWSDLQHAYQKLSLLTDTLPKKMRREQVESQLDELERFVNLIEKHKVIVVADVGHGAAAMRF